MGRLLVCAALLCSLLVAEAVAEADKPAVAMIGFDALGMDEERVQRLETLFLKELERLTGKRVPNRRSVARLKKKLRNCDGGNKCLGAIGKALSVDFVVSGNVASLGDSYILNIKAVASKSGAELRRIESDPLRGQPDELIDAIRVAAYRLLAPDELVGSITVLADRAGAVVELDSKVIGKTPLTKPIEGLTLGEHHVKADPDPNAGLHLVNQDRPKRWYQKTWFLASAGVGVGVLGAIIGYTLAKTDIISCPERPECTP
jgi:TolB-like protein